MRVPGLGGRSSSIAASASATIAMASGSQSGPSRRSASRSVGRALTSSRDRFAGSDRLARQATAQIAGSSFRCTNAGTTHPSDGPDPTVARSPDQHVLPLIVLSGRAWLTSVAGYLGRAVVEQEAPRTDTADA